MDFVSTGKKEIGRLASVLVKKEESRTKEIRKNDFV